jgi:aminodeoxyfutalosine synthase
MTAWSLPDAQAILDSLDPIAIGARADAARRARHGNRTTFVRVLEAHVDAVPSVWPANAAAGELRVIGRPGTIDAAAGAVRRAIACAGRVPVTAFSLADLAALASESGRALRDVLAALRDAGLAAIAELPIDAVDDPAGAVAAATAAGLAVPRVTVHQLAAADRLRTVQLARDLQDATGAVAAFAPLARHSSAAQPSTGYDDVKQVAIARLLADNIPSIQVDWALYGPKLAQVALTMGADDVDAVSPFEGDLGRRRSPIEEIRANIAAAGLEPVERDARGEPRA